MEETLEPARPGRTGEWFKSMEDSPDCSNKSPERARKAKH